MGTSKVDAGKSGGRRCKYRNNVPISFVGISPCLEKGKKLNLWILFTYAIITVKGRLIEL